MRNHTQRICVSLRDSLRILILLLFALPAHAQIDNVLGTSINLSTGAFNGSQFLTPSQATVSSSTTSSFYALYPSLSLKSTRPGSTLTANYAFGYNRTVRSVVGQTVSHTAALNYSKKLSSRWSASLSDSFRMTDGLGTFNALSGGTQSSSGFAFPFQPIGGRKLPRTNEADGSLSWALDSVSSLSFSGRHSIRSYGGITPINPLITDQKQLSGSVAFQQKLGTNDSWGLSWSATDHDYGNSQRTISQSGQADYSMGIGQYSSLRVGAGVSRMNNRSMPGSKLHYDALIDLSRIGPTQSFSLSFTQNTTDRLGLGGATSTRRATLDWNRTIGRATVSARASAHKSEGALGNTVNSKGIHADANLGIPLSTRLSIAGGANFRNTGTGSLGFTQRRVFYNASLSYSLTTTLFLSGNATFSDSSQTGVSDFTQRRLFFSLRYSQPTLIRFR